MKLYFIAASEGGEGVDWFIEAAGPDHARGLHRNYICPVETDQPFPVVPVHEIPPLTGKARVLAWRGDAPEDQPNEGAINA